MTYTWCIHNIYIFICVDTVICFFLVRLSEGHIVTVTPPGTMARGCGTCLAWGTASFFLHSPQLPLLLLILMLACCLSWYLFNILEIAFSFGPTCRVVVASFDAWCWARNSFPHHNKMTVEHWQMLMTSQAAKVICFHREAPRGNPLNGTIAIFSTF